MSLTPYYDKLLGTVREADGLTQDQADARYVNISGDTMTGDLNFPTTGFIMNSATTTSAGSPIGLLLSLTYASGGGGNRYRVTVDSSGTIVTTLI